MRRHYFVMLNALKRENMTSFFLCLHNILLRMNTKFSLSNPLLMGVWVDSMSFLLWIVLWWTYCACIFLVEWYYFPLEIDEAENSKVPIHLILCQQEWQFMYTHLKKLVFHIYTLLIWNAHSAFLKGIALSND